MANNKCIPILENDKEPSATVNKYRSGNIFLLDITPGMFFETYDSHFHQALTVIHGMLMEKLFYSPQDYVSLILIGTMENMSNIESIKNIYRVMPFSRIKREHVKKIRNLLDENDVDLTTYSSEEFPLIETLTFAIDMFREVTISMAFRRIDLITCFNEPSSREDEATLYRLADRLRDLNIEFKVSGPDHGFYYEQFWKDLVVRANNSEIVPVPCRLLAIDSDVLRGPKDIKKCVLKVNNKIIMKVNIQPYAIEPPVLKKVMLNKKTNELLRSNISYRIWEINDNEGGEQGMVFKGTETDIIKATGLAGSSIRFHSHEFKKWEHLTDLGINIITFVQCSFDKRPRIHLEEAWHVSLPQDATEQEKNFFAALFIQCQEKETAAICIASICSGKPTGRYTMWPNPMDNGFYLYKLPWQGDIKKNVHNFVGMANIYRDRFKLDSDKLELMINVLLQFVKKNKPSFQNPNELKKIIHIFHLANMPSNNDPVFLDPTQPRAEEMKCVLRMRQLTEPFYKVFPPRESVLQRAAKKSSTSGTSLVKRVRLS